MSVRTEVVIDLRRFAALLAVARFKRETAIKNRAGYARSVVRFRLAFEKRAKALDASADEIAEARAFGQFFGTFVRAEHANGIEF
jgi:hypothetical protein